MRLARFTLAPTRSLALGDGDAVTSAAPSRIAGYMAEISRSFRDMHYSDQEIIDRLQVLKEYTGRKVEAAMGEIVLFLRAQGYGYSSSGIRSQSNGQVFVSLTPGSTFLQAVPPRGYFDGEVVFAHTPGTDHSFTRVTPTDARKYFVTTSVGNFGIPLSDPLTTSRFGELNAQSYGLIQRRGAVSLLLDIVTGHRVPEWNAAAAGSPNAYDSFWQLAADPLNPINLAPGLLVNPITGRPFAAYDIHQAEDPADHTGSIPDSRSGSFARVIPGMETIMDVDKDYSLHDVVPKKSSLSGLLAIAAGAYLLTKGH